MAVTGTRNRLSGTNGDATETAPETPKRDPKLGLTFADFAGPISDTSKSAIKFMAVVEGRLAKCSVAGRPDSLSRADILKTISESPAVTFSIPADAKYLDPETGKPKSGENVTGVTTGVRVVPGLATAVLAPTV